MEEQKFIQIRFKDTVNINGANIDYSDALYFTEAEYNAKSQAEIDALKQARVDNFKYIVEHPAPPHVPTAQELQAELASITEQEQSLASRKIELQAQIAHAEPIEEPIPEPIEGIGR
jgi:hypothetical protein